MSNKYKEGIKYSKSKKAWIAVFYDVNNKYNELYFTIKFYGEEKSKELAEESFKNKKDMRKKQNIYIEKENYYILQILYKDKYIDTYISKKDFEAVKKYKWYILLEKNTWYVSTNNKDVHISLHRYLTGNIKNKIVDHIDRNGLNNRQENLRVVDKYINNRNMNVRRDNKSGIIGVFQTKHNWVAKWYDENHKDCQKSFSIKKYGNQHAFEMAVEVRLRMATENEYIIDKNTLNENILNCSETIKKQIDDSI